MIYDGENLFFKKQALSNTTLTSDIIDYGKGEANDPPKLVVEVSKDAGAGSVTATVQTSDDSTFSSPVTLFTKASPTFTSAVTLADFKGPVISAPLPRGSMRYLRISAVSTFTDGKMTAGLVLDDDVR